MKTLRTMSVSCLIIAVGALSCGEAHGYHVQRGFVSNPAGICQGALPAFETAIRKRPLAVQNEGTTTAFVTCSFTSQGAWGESFDNPQYVEVFFTNVSDREVQLSCTGVTGGAVGRENDYLVKTVALAAGGGQRRMTWAAGDFSTGSYQGRFRSGFFSISCGLPPGVAINESFVTFSEDVGEW